PDGQFPNVTKTPNPEVRESLDRAERVAREHRAHLVIATDPDADRIGGLAARDKDGGGEYRFLTGNEICALVTHFKLTQLQKGGTRTPAGPRSCWPRWPSNRSARGGRCPTTWTPWPGSSGTSATRCSTLS